MIDGNFMEIIVDIYNARMYPAGILISDKNSEGFS